MSADCASDRIHQRAVAHRNAAMRLLETIDPGPDQTLAALVALTHATLALEARVEEWTELAPR